MQELGSEENLHCFRMHGDRQFAVAAANLWNWLPVSLRTAKTLPHYKTLLETNLFRV